MTMQAEWQTKRADHQRAVLHLADQVATALGNDWARVHDAEREYGAHLLRNDGLEISLWWDDGRDGRLSVSPVVPQIPGPMEVERDIRITCDPKRPPARIAADIQRRVVEPWEPKLALLRERQRRTRLQRQEATVFYERLAGILPQQYPGRQTGALEGLRQGNDATLSIGSFNHPTMNGSLTVGTYKDRTDFKFTVESRKVALEIVELLATMLEGE